ncbi:hypothetical protein DFH08DRAFT_816906 [Mycena albidolilacea]|uniref:Uncharacterized protein n=1 Tax=Mycena albidolilacea TaxID=1033008 RepID=A0AAD6ZJ53_9AGAR|nr:hypothetical protein DFH08DRAFT_816906 [Mycena albidolilacea]
MMRSIPPNSHQQLSIRIHLPPSVASRYRGSLALRYRAPVALRYGLAPTQSQSIWNILRSMAERPTSRESDNPEARGDPPSDKNGVDLLRNRSTADQLFLHCDMRYGPDNPTLWPQQYSAHYCHLGAIPRKPPPQQDRAPDIMIMFGQLRQDKCYLFQKLVDKLLDECKAYTASIAPAKVTPLLLQMAQVVRLALEWLRSVPSTYDRMVLRVTGLQRAYLELTGLLRYLSIYKPCMENPDVEAGLPDDCIGVFTSDPAIAQQFHIARLPYWFIRPLSAFNNEIILSVVPLLDPTTMLLLDAAPGYPSVPVGTDHDQRIRSLHLCMQNVPWYKNPFASPVAPSEQSTVSSVQPPQQAVAGPSRTSQSSTIKKSNRPHPYKEAREKAKAAKAARGPNPAAQDERDKYTIFDSPFMPAVIDRWADALAKVDRSQPARYVKDLTAKALCVCPEPALLVLSTGPRSQVALHHYQLIHNALLYHLGDPDDLHWALPTQVWHDILQGKVSKQGKPGARTEARSASIEAVLGPALKACGIDKLSGFLADGDPIPLTTRNRSKELLWELAEINFRF